jgi:RNA polymerase sigma-70 factor (ECF subfamily)
MKTMAIDSFMARVRPEMSERPDCLSAFQGEFDYLCRTLRRLGVPGSDVEDLVHEVFLVLYRRWRDYDASLPLRPWLFGIAFRVASAHRKRAAREVPHAWIEVADDGPRPDQAAVAKQARALVIDALEKVPLPRRAVLVMHDLDGAAMRDIASTLSIPLFTAYSRLRKARKEFEGAVRRLKHQGHPARENRRGDQR